MDWFKELTSIEWGRESALLLQISRREGLSAVVKSGAETVLGPISGWCAGEKKEVSEGTLLSFGPNAFSVADVISVFIAELRN